MAKFNTLSVSNIAVITQPILQLHKIHSAILYQCDLIAICISVLHHASVSGIIKMSMCDGVLEDRRMKQSY